MTQLVVKEGTAVYRWFAWSLEVIERFSVRDDDKAPTDYLAQGTNLCHMMRVLLIWAPLIFLIEAAGSLAAFYFLVVWPCPGFKRSSPYSSSGYLVSRMAKRDIPQVFWCNVARSGNSSCVLPK